MIGKARAASKQRGRVDQAHASAPAARIMRQEQLVKGNLGRRPGAPDPISVAITTDRLDVVGENLAILPQVSLGDRDFPDGAGLDVEQLDVSLQVRLGFAAVEDLDDMRLISMVPQQVEPALEAVGVEQVANDDRQTPALAAMDEVSRHPFRDRSPFLAARALRGT